MNDSFQILAKSEPPTTLQQHIEDCLQIEEQLKDCFPNLPIDYSEFFWELVRTSICFHDVGKCHKEFQKLLYKKDNAWNHRRHELFSIPFVIHSDIPNDNKELVIYAVAGHHKDLEELYNIVQREYNNSIFQECIRKEDDGFESDCNGLLHNKAWKILASYGISKQNDKNTPILEVVRHLKLSFFPAGHSSFLLRLLLVGYLKQCDHLASAGICHLNKIEEKDFSFLHSYNLYHHQKEAYRSAGNTFLTAPTGAGKTETSLLWLENQIQTYGQGRTFYILPYTASINAMYERLSKQMGSKHVGMLHGKLSQYFDSKFDDCTNDIDVRAIKESYKTLVTPLKVVTPFQLLKSIFGLKHFEKGLSEWVGGYFIFDEIHAYDSRTLAQIVIMLEICTKWLNGKVFIMTATMPTHILNLLKEVFDTSNTIIAERQLYQSFNRHKVVLENGLLIDSIDDIQQDINTGKKVLVVCNTVEQAQKVYELLRCKKKILLHSSFNATDRSVKEQRLQKEDVQLLVGTQAIEVSLDIDYDTIYTEPAPIDALIQRFGRVNRRRKKGLCDCHVYRIQNESDKYIYEKEVVAHTIQVLEAVNNNVIQEKDIQEMIDKVYPCFSKQQKNEYDMTYTGLKIGIENRLQPLHYDEKSEEDFYRQFDGIKVLPSSLLDQYRLLMEQNRIIKAEGLLVSIRESRFCFMFKSGDIYRQRVWYTSSDNKIIDKQVLVINRKYDAELGLQLNIEDNTTNFL